MMAALSGSQPKDEKSINEKINNVVSETRCTSTDNGYRLEILDLQGIGIVLSM